MDNSVPLRWIAEAEARSVQQIARYQRAEAQSRNGPASTRGTGQGWFDRLRQLVPRGAGNLSAEVEPDRVLVAVLITDIVDSTKLVVDIGDRNWRALLDRHDDAARRQIRRF